MLTNLLKESDPKAAFNECVVADGLTNDAKLHDLCSELQKKVAAGRQLGRTAGGTSHSQIAVI